MDDLISLRPLTGTVPIRDGAVQVKVRGIGLGEFLDIVGKDDGLRAAINGVIERTWLRERSPAAKANGHAPADESDADVMSALRGTLEAHPIDVARALVAGGAAVDQLVAAAALNIERDTLRYLTVQEQGAILAKALEQSLPFTRSFLAEIKRRAAALDLDGMIGAAFENDETPSTSGMPSVSPLPT